MFKNYLKIALRNLLKHKTYSFLNVIGLTIGMACCLLIFLFVRNELAFDRFHEHAERIYRVVCARQWDGNVLKGANSPVPLGPALEQDFPEIENAVRFWRAFQPIISHQNNHFREGKFYFTDPAVFSMFSFTLLKGDPQTALMAPHTVVITAMQAQKYFGDGDPIGQTLAYRGYPGNGNLEFTVTGVLRDLPGNTHFDFDFLASLQGIETERNNWGSFKPIWTYVLLPENYPPEQLENKLPGFVDRYLRSRWSENVSLNLHLENLVDIHLYSSFSGGFKPNSDIVYIYLFSAIGFFILLIACINFMNLSTARSLTRMKEVGMRKVLGARRSQLAKQFMGEAIILCGLALLLAFALAEGLLPVFNSVAAQSLRIDYFSDLLVLPAFFGIALLVSLLSGSYPAIFLSAFRPVTALNTRALPGGASVRLRKGLVIFQFVISSILMIGTVVVYGQLDYVRSKNLGFEKEQVVVLPYSGKEQPLITALLQHPNVVNASVSQRVPVNARNRDRRSILPEGSQQPIQVESYIIDSRFLETYGIKLAKGRNFSRVTPTDAGAFLVNETAVQEFAWSTPEAAIGKSIDWGPGQKKGRVIGVVKDFYLASLHTKIAPLVLQMLPEESWWRTFITVRIRPQNISQTLAFLEKTWKNFNQEGAYEYFFIDESYEELHRADERFGQLFGYFATLAIFIACLGLFGLAAFTAEQRTKEVGIRKVLGASVANVTALLSKDFVKLVLLANVIAWPIAWYAMHKWLQDFAYRIELGWWVFALSGGMMLVIALLTVSTQAIKAALANPVKSLRYE